MITKKQFLNSFAAEMNIIRHLGTKVEASMLDYRPSEKQRSTLELMNYLGHIFDVSTTLISAGDMSNYMELIKAAPVVTLENFDQVMRDQTATVVAKIEALADADFEKEINMFGRMDTVSMHLFGISKIAAAYKMQLFLYIKANGKHDIGTSNLWAGVDAPSKQ